MLILKAKEEKGYYEFLEGKNSLGEAYLNGRLASRIHDRDRVNYYLEVLSGQLSIEKIKLLVAKAEHLHKSSNVTKGRIYTCLRAGDDRIGFYEAMPGFKKDEFMYIMEAKVMKKPQNLTGALTWDFLLSPGNRHKFLEAHDAIFHGAYDAADLLELLDQGIQVVTALDGDAIMGQCMFHKNGWIEDLFISPAYRRRGLGRILTTEAINKLYDLGVKTTQLEVWSTNHKAINLYQSMGFEIIRTSEVSIGINIGK